jgi:hypothetical protein
VEISVVVMVASNGWPCCARLAAGRPVACPLLLSRGAAVVSGVKGGPQGRRPQGDAQHP